MTIDVNYALEILPDLLRAAVVTIQATVGGMAVALVVGLFLTIARLGRFRPLAIGATFLIEFIRCTPLLVQLFVAFYLLPEYGISFSPLVTGILVLGLHYGAYTAEVYRAGILGVARVQWEAAMVLGFPSATIWRRVILPQAIPPVLPILGNYWISMYKDTPMLAIITVEELLGKAQAVVFLSYRYIEPITLVGLIFLVLSLSTAALFQAIERSLANR